MDEPHYVSHARNMVKLIGDLQEANYEANVSTRMQLYIKLSNDEFFARYMYMTLILLGENAKHIEKSIKKMPKLERRSNMALDSLQKKCRTLRVSRNNIAHYYNSLDSFETSDIIFNFAKQVVYDLRVFSHLKQFDLGDEQWLDQLEDRYTQ